MATVSAESVPESRPLTADERALVRWMLERGGPQAPSYLPHLDSARVVERRCPCGCASIDFGVGGKQAPAGDGLEVLADFPWRAAGCAGRSSSPAAASSPASMSGPSTGRPSPRCYPGPRRSRRWSSDHSSGPRDGRDRPARQEAPTAPAKQYEVTLTPDERGRLDALTTAGKRAARTITRARILLLTDQGDGGPGWEDRRAAEALGCSPRTAERVRERFVTDGLDAALAHKPRDKPSRTPVLDGKAEARLVALACAATPDGRKAWTLRLPADKLVEPEVVEAVSHETVRRALKKMP